LTVYTSLPIADIVRDYEAGASLRALASKHMVSYGTIRRVLGAADVPLRNPGTQRDPTNTHKIEVEYTPRSLWAQPQGGLLHPQEVDRLRRAIGWTADWTRPYDPARGD